jgi:hypothetical protein
LDVNDTWARVERSSQKSGAGFLVRAAVYFKAEVAADLQAGFRAWDVEIARAVRVADANVFYCFRLSCNDCVSSEIPETRRQQELQQTSTKPSVCSFEIHFLLEETAARTQM